MIPEPFPSPARFLIIRPSAMGDVARTVPALVSLRAAFPNSQIDWVVDAGLEAIIDEHPALSRAVPFPKRTIKASLRRCSIGPLKRFLGDLREARYDAVFDLQGLARSAVIAVGCGAKTRYGLRDAREFAHLAYSHTAEADPEMHTVDRMLAVITAAGVSPIRDMRLYTSPRARAWLTTQDWSAAPYAVLAPTSRWRSKQWPADRFAGVAEHLIGAGMRVVFVGARGEEDQAGPVLALCGRDQRAVNMIGRTSVAELMGIIERAALVVANDSAALHISVGLDRPLIALFGPTRVHRVGPYGRGADVIQHLRPGDSMRHKDPSSAVMMERITLREVIEMAERRLTGSGTEHRDEPPPAQTGNG